MIRESDAPRIAAEVRARVVEQRVRSARGGGRPMEEVLNETLFHERRRLARAPDREEERQFYQRIASNLPRASEAELLRMLSSVVARYVREIEGHFDPKIYSLATRVLPVGIAGLLNGFSPRTFVKRGTLPSFDNQIQVEGRLDTLRHLNERGTVLYVPTHSSNLDSIILGSGLHQLGLPPATYGAGLNLFENRIVGYFMQNLGAYTVDRLKTDPLYRDTLKDYSTVILEYGRHQLFFPGGTRCRSGALETYLKKGLLGTALSAYAHQLKRGRDRRLYIVPVTVNYPLVLEASTLIDDYLQHSGQSRYIIVDDEFSQLDRWAAYGRGLLRLNMQIHLRFGAPLDPFGNDVTDDGDSLDPSGRVIDPSGYLKLAGKVRDDAARDAEYTRMLARRIITSYKENNVVCATHVVAFALFHALYRREQPRDLYRFLRALGPDVSMRIEDFLPTLRTLLREVEELAFAEKIHRADAIVGVSAEDILEQAVKMLATYHTRPVVVRVGDRLAVEDANLLFYYRNRLEYYGFLGEKTMLNERHEH